MKFFVEVDHSKDKLKNGKIGEGKHELQAFKRHTAKVMSQLSFASAISSKKINLQEVMPRLEQDSFAKEHKKMRLQFYKVNESFLSDTKLGSKSASNDRIPVEYEKLDEFIKEIKKIRNFSNKEIFNYQDEILRTVLTSPNSSFAAILLFETSIRIEFLYLIYLTDVLNSKNYIHAEKQGYKKEVDETTIFSNSDFRKHVKEYSIFLRMLYVAHSQCLPNFYEPNKDKISSNCDDDDSNRYIF